MQCVWCDTPSKEHDMDRIIKLMDLYSQKHTDYLIRPADFTKVDEAIAKIPEDLSIYTTESVESLIQQLIILIVASELQNKVLLMGMQPLLNRQLSI